MQNLKGSKHVIKSQPIVAAEQELHSASFGYFRALNNGDLSALDECVARDVINHSRQQQGIENLKSYITALRAGFPDLTYEILHTAMNGTIVAVHSRVTGVNTGKLFNSEPTHKKVDVEQMLFKRIEDGKIVEIWQLWDEVRMQAQLNQNG